MRKNEIIELAFEIYPKLINDPYNPSEDDNEEYRNIWISGFEAGLKINQDDVDWEDINKILDAYQVECQLKYNTGTVPDAREWFANTLSSSSETSQNKIDSDVNDDASTIDDDNDDINNYLKSKQFQKDFAEEVTNHTWNVKTKDGKGLPKIYMNDLGDIVEHWKDGVINILNTKRELEQKETERLEKLKKG